MLENELIANTLSVITNLSVSFMVVAVVFVAFFIYAWKTSKGKSIALLVGILVSGILYSALAETTIYKDVFSKNIHGFIPNMVIFSILIVITTFVFRGFCKGLYAEERIKRLFQMGAFAAVAGGILMTQAYKLLGVETLYDFSSGVDFVFGGEYSFLAWLTMSLVVLLIIKTRR